MTRMPGVNRNVGVGQTPNSAILSDSSSEILSSANRAGAILINIGSKDAWISCDAAAVINKGIKIGKNGGYFILDQTWSTNGPIYGVTSAGNTTISYQELI